MKLKRIFHTSNNRKRFMGYSVLTWQQAKPIVPPHPFPWIPDNMYNTHIQRQTSHFDGTVKVFFEEVDDDSWIFGLEVPSSVECHQLPHWDISHTSASRPWSWPPVTGLKTKTSIQRLSRKVQSYAVMFLMTLCEIQNNGRKRVQNLQTFPRFSNLPL